MSGATTPPVERLKVLEENYSRGAERPLGSYAGLLGLYSGSVITGMLAARRRGWRLPERPDAADVALLAVATFRASRLITKDSVTAVARAPFTRFQGPGAPGEVNEEVIGTGPRHAIGELLSCPFCISVWLATAGAFGMVGQPRLTRAACSVLAAVAGADVLQYAFSALDRLEH